MFVKRIDIETYRTGFDKIYTAFTKVEVTTEFKTINKDNR